MSGTDSLFDQIRLERPSLVKAPLSVQWRLYAYMLAVHLVTVHLLAAAWMAPEVSEEEGSYASRVYHWFSESSKSCLLFLIAPPGLIDILAQLLAWRSLLWLSMTWRQRFLFFRVLTQKYVHNTISLTWSLVLHLSCYSVGKSQWNETNTYTH